MNETGRALVILLLIVTALAAVEAVVLVRMESRVAELENRTLPPGSGDGTPLALGEEMWELREKVGVVEDRLTVVTKTQTAMRKDLDRGIAKVEGTPGKPGALDTSPGAALGKLDPDSIEKAVARAVDEKLKDRPQHENGEWKPTLKQLQDALELSEGQTEKAERIFDDAKHEVFELASLRREDGSAVIDGFVTAMKSADPESEMKKVFMGLFTEKIPGREQTYIAEILRIKARAQKSLEGVLDADQLKKLSRTNLDHLGVHTAYDPFGEYIQEALQQR